MAHSQPDHRRSRRSIFGGLSWLSPWTSSSRPRNP